MQPADYFKRIPLFSDLAPEEIVDVLRIARVVTFPAGKPLCTRGERGDCAYVIEEGEAEVRASAEQGGALVSIARVGPGEVVGELSLVDGHPRSADVVAVTSVRGYRIDRAELDALRRAMHPAAFKILRRIAITVSDRLRDVNDAIAVELLKAAADREPKAAPGRASKIAERLGGAKEQASDPGRVSRAQSRASRDIERASMTGLAPVRKSVVGDPPPSAAKPKRPASAQHAKPEPAPAAPAGSLWGSMLKKLGGSPWK